MLMGIGAALGTAVLVSSVFFVGIVSAAPKQAAANSVSFQHACGAAAAGFARCHVILKVSGKPDGGGSPSGLSPSDLQSAYKLSATGGNGQTIAIVDAYDDPNAEADISAIGDPNTGVSVYDTYRESGWLVFGGASVATPIIASVYALANNASTVGGNASYLYSHTSSYFDVTSGSNGNCGSLLCNATTGWDGPTGLGTPNGSGGF